MSNEATIAGRRFIVEPMDARAAFEVECILLAVLGPGLSAGLAAVVEPALEHMADHVRKHLTTATEDDQAEFDLARIETLLDTLDTTGGVVRSVVEAMLDGLGPIFGRTIDTAAPVVIEQIGWDRIRRLIELAVFGVVFVVVDGQPRKIVDWKGLDAATRRDWLAKWSLLLEVLRMHFARVRESEPIG